jgi:hypothetical protein
MNVFVLKIVYLRKAFVNMNRLVIIGNGFDLAHGLPTSYKDFIDDYWEGIQNSEYKDDFISFGYKSRIEFTSNKNLFDLSKYFIAVDEQVKFSEAEIYLEYGNNHLTGKHPRNHILNYKNIFFRLINKKSIQNWVDIENEYYRELKSIVTLKPENSLIDYNEFEISRKEKIIILNKEFEQVKNLLEIYLNKIDKIQSVDNSILKYFKLIKENVEDYFLEFPKQDHEVLEAIQHVFNTNIEMGKNQNTYFLNFNYTRTVCEYTKLMKKYGEDRLYGKVEEIQIHGQLNQDDNKINFGFGDEMDDDYKAIENLDDNEYLRNFKSFQYLQNSNYKKLLDFIDSEKFQVIIMGHSCGLSDRTLLNTVFEHNNCRSIKVFYHETKDENGKVIKDNYTEIIQNISRHFNKKKLMREKIVNKTLCQPLPQIKLPLK